MAHTVPQILAHEIAKIEKHPTKDIFFIYRNGDTTASLVLKQEIRKGRMEDQATSISWGSKIMKNVTSRLVNTKIISDIERNEIINASLFAIRQGKQIYSTAQLKAIEDGIRDFRNPLIMWVKMPAVAELWNANYLYNDGSPGPLKQDMVIVKQCIARFSSDGFWYEMGKIAAVDLFIGNGDRFDKDGWVNQGNIFMAGSTPIGLDTFDRSNQDIMLTNTMSKPRALLPLQSTQAMTGYAKKILEDVGDRFHDAFVRNDVAGTKVLGLNGDILHIPRELLKTLFVSCTDDMVRGMTDAVAGIKAYLLKKMAEPDRARHSDVWNRTTTTSSQPKANHGRPSGGFMGNNHRSATPQHQPHGNASAGLKPPLPAGVIDRMRIMRWI